jgi:hypothetical protein
MSTYNDSQAPATNGTNNTNGQDLKNAIVNNASAALNTVQNHPVTQNVVNGPVATSIKNEAGVTANEFSDLAAARQTPSYTAANDTPLTHYHSFFYTLLSWKNKRATGISFVAAISFIFACRYLPVLRYFLKLSWMTLGVVTLAEVSSKVALGSSVTSSVRPRKYYRIPKETLESSLDDLENLINFFVIEAQRIIFAENILVTGFAFFTALISYYLIKLLPLWGMALIGTTVAFLGPLIYLENKEVIDQQIEHASHVIGQQTTQIKDITAQHTSQGLDTVKQYTSTYTAKAQEAIGSTGFGQSRQKIPEVNSSKPVAKQSDFPTAPKSNLESDFPSAPRSTLKDDFPSAPKSDLQSGYPSAIKSDLLYQPADKPAEADGPITG